jgi:peptidoglycan/xylan/chitin deacetylase (PgdA/CDA1 family)
MTPVWIGVLVVAFLALSARWNWWRPCRHGIPILMYHKVGDAPPGSKMLKLWVSSTMFRRQMNYLKKRGWTPVVFRDLYDHWSGVNPLPEKPLLITFDDGYANNYAEAFPILKEFGFRATLFVVTGTVGIDNKWHNPESETRIPMITWAQLKELQRAGWEIGSHTVNHPRLLTLDKAAVTREMEDSRKTISEFLDELPDTFAYPYGNGEDDPSIRQAAEEAGYRVAVGIHPGKWTLERIKSSAFNLPRVFVRGDENLFDFHLQVTRGKSRL